MGVSGPVTTAARNRLLDFHGRPVFEEVSGKHTPTPGQELLLRGAEGEGVSFFTFGGRNSWDSTGQYRGRSKRPARGLRVNSNATQESPTYEVQEYIRCIVIENSCLGDKEGCKIKRIFKARTFQRNLIGFHGGKKKTMKNILNGG